MTTTIKTDAEDLTLKVRSYSFERDLGEQVRASEALQLVHYTPGNEVAIPYYLHQVISPSFVLHLGYNTSRDTRGSSASMNKMIKDYPATPKELDTYVGMPFSLPPEIEREIAERIGKGESMWDVAPSEIDQLMMQVTHRVLTDYLRKPELTNLDDLSSPGDFAAILTTAQAYGRGLGLPTALLPELVTRFDHLIDLHKRNAYTAIREGKLDGELPGGDFIAWYLSEFDALRKIQTVTGMDLVQDLATIERGVREVAAANSWILRYDLKKGDNASPESAPGPFEDSVGDDRAEEKRIERLFSKFEQEVPPRQPNRIVEEL